VTLGQTPVRLSPARLLALFVRAWNYDHPQKAEAGEAHRIH
jgi:hypothetical protein